MSARLCRHAVFGPGCNFGAHCKSLHPVDVAAAVRAVAASGSGTLALCPAGDACPDPAGCGALHVAVKEAASAPAPASTAFVASAAFAGHGTGTAITTPVRPRGGSSRGRSVSSGRSAAPADPFDAAAAHLRRALASLDRAAAAYQTLATDLSSEAAARKAAACTAARERALAQLEAIGAELEALLPTLE
jgi:hypothetical protein